jgi:hypothetical protein
MPESPQRQASFADCLELLKAFNQCDAPAVIVGDQAVNFWAEMFAGQEQELAQYRPFTSADLDLHSPKPDPCDRGHRDHLTLLDVN